MTALTIYTPTYNRVKLLPRVYESLCRQTVKDFVWIIIDDGSTDNTKEIIDLWIKEKKINIKYYYKENGGVHTARDFAYKICETELIVSCDSDDWLCDNAVELWLKTWNKHNSEKCAGIFSVVVDENGNRVTSQFPKKEYLSYQDFTYKYKCTGEKQTLLKAEIIKKIPDAPVFKGEKLVGEGYKWIQLPDDGVFILLDKPTRIYEKQPDGYIKGVSKSRIKNAHGFQALYKQHIISGKYLKTRIKGYMGYVAFSLIVKDRFFIQRSPHPLMTLLFVPIGLVLCLKYKHDAK